MGIGPDLVPNLMHPPYNLRPFNGLHETAPGGAAGTPGTLWEIGFYLESFN